MTFIKKLKEEVLESKDYKFREFIIKRKKVYLIFNEVLCSTTMINDFILDNLVSFSKKELNNIMYYLPDSNVLEINKSDVFTYLNQGFCIIITNKIYAIEVRERLDRGINSVERELSVTGPKDSFTELFNSNLGLIRRRIKSTKLFSLDLEIGRYSKTKVSVLGIKGIVKDELVKSIYNKLKNINIDGIIDSSYIKSYLENKSLFPTVMLTERPDKASQALLEGKVIILCDLSPYAIILPSFFIDFFHTADDYYQKKIKEGKRKVILALLEL